jgi:prepilin-type N-terminal cleavage/methylation domain-containing protein
MYIFSLKEKGFSLVELIFGISLLSIVLLIVPYSINIYYQSNQTYLDRNKMNQLAKNELEFIKTNTTSGVTTDTIIDINEKFAKEINITNGFSYNGTSYQEIRQIKITIIQKETNQNYVLQTLYDPVESNNKGNIHDINSRKITSNPTTNQATDLSDYLANHPDKKSLIQKILLWGLYIVLN